MKINCFFKRILSVLVVLLLLILSSCNSDEEITPEIMQQGRSVKRGVSYNFQIADDANMLGTGVSWFYNWGTTVNNDVNLLTSENKIDYFPMAWNGSFNASQIRSYKAIHPDCKYILAYNEPNLTDQANMTPQQAAAQWPALRSLATELGMKLISPAMNYGTLAGYSDPVKWLDEFFTLVPLSDVDGIAVHCYMSNAGALYWYLNKFKKYNKPIWLTEFCAWENSIKSATDQMKYMSDALNYLECDKDVVRYAWFIPRANGSVDSYPYMQLLTKTNPYELTALGKVYVNMSSQDKAVYYSQSSRIPAEHYSSTNTVETLTTGSFAYTVRVRPTTDIDGLLEIYDFLPGYWVEYQIQAGGSSRKKLNFRYAATDDTAITIYVDGTAEATCNFKATGSENVWKTTSSPINISEGKHTLRIKLNTGRLILNWLSVTNK
jgi:hypothetical protein